MDRKIRVAITQGDYNGVGPEVVLKALAEPELLEMVTPMLFADRAIVEKACTQFRLNLPEIAYIDDPAKAKDDRINIVDRHIKIPDFTPGRPTKGSGASAVASLRDALKAVMEGKADVLVTAPISKEAVQSDDFHFSGHTEFMGEMAGATPQMILFDDRLRVALVTTHLPVSKISEAITKEKVEDSIRRFNDSLRKDFGIVRPKIAVLSLNPHCGDGGLLGSEEAEIIQPAIDSCIEDGKVMAFGPYPADGFFGSGAYKKFDGVLAMYHDQGLAPFKTLAGDAGVNYTAGLSVVRTSPDHGTAYDLAWKGQADPTSMRTAIFRAVDILRNRQRWFEASANPLRRQQPAERGAKGGRFRRENDENVPGLNEDVEPENSKQ